MLGLEIRHQLTGTGVDAHPFVRWWRKENDFVDYDLATRFRDTLRDGEEFGGIELLTMDQMWQELKRVCGERIDHYRTTRSGDIVEWTRFEGMVRHVEIYPYTAETLLTIYDEETRGNPLC